MGMQMQSQLKQKLVYPRLLQNRRRLSVIWCAGRCRFCRHGSLLNRRDRGVGRGGGCKGSRLEDAEIVLGNGTDIVVVCRAVSVQQTLQRSVVVNKGLGGLVS